MAATKREPERRRSSSDATMAAVLALQIDRREREVAEDRNAVKTELLLARAGLPPEEIAALTGKSLDAVRKTIQRAKAR